MFEVQQSRMAEAVARLVAAVERLTPADARRAPAPEEWPAVKLLAHVAEMLPYWARQASEVARRDQPDQAVGRSHDDPVRIAAIEAGAGGDPSQLAAAVRLGLAEAVEVLRGIPAEHLSRTARHARLGTMSVAEVVERFMVSHSEEHAAQAEAIVAALRGGSRVPTSH